MRWSVAASLFLACAGGAAAQIPLGPDSTDALVLERGTRDRWVHEGQHPGFVPFLQTTDAVHLVGLNRPGRFPVRSLQLRLRNLEASLTLGAGNRIDMARIELPRLVYSRYDEDENRADLRRRMLAGNGAALNLPYARVWEVPFVVPDRPLTPGTTWSDTLSFVADPGDGLSERLEGVWRNRVVGDTTVAGRRLPVVRVEADVRYRTTEVIRDDSFEGSFIVDRDVRGLITGFAIVDTLLGIRAGGADTAAWAGTAVLKTQEGRAFPSGVRYERVRTWALRDSTTWADSAAASRRRRDSGMMMLPSTSIEERLLARDSALADSLFGRWRAASDPDERAEVERLLYRWWARGPEAGRALTARLLRLHREGGDSTRALLTFTGSLAERLTEERARGVLPYLDDIGRAWKLGIVPTWTYAELAGLLVRASPVLEPDSTAWGCTPAGCRLLLAALETASEPRLRDAALAGTFARDPARWVGRLRARADSGSNVVRHALLLGDGVGATWPAAPRDPVPAPGAGWPAWLSWMGGSVRFEGSHRDALLMYAARTGRDPVAELSEAWPPEGDSARLVMGTVLTGMGGSAAPTPEALAEDFLSGSPARIALATQDLHRLLGPSAPLADSAVAAALLSAVLDAVVAGGDSPWPAVDGLPLRPGDRVLSPFATSFHGVRGVPLFVRAETLPAGVRLSLPAPLQAVDSAAWSARPLRSGGVLVEVQPVRAVGGFVELVWSWTAFSARGPEEAPRGYAGGGGLTLLRTEDGWRVVARQAWIT